MLEEEDGNGAASHEAAKSGRLIEEEDRATGRRTPLCMLEVVIDMLNCLCTIIPPLSLLKRKWLHMISRLLEAFLSTRHRQLTPAGGYTVHPRSSP